MTPGERLALAMEMSDAARALTESGVRRRHPDWTAERVRAEVLRLCCAATGDLR